MEFLVGNCRGTRLYVAPKGRQVFVVLECTRVFRHRRLDEEFIAAVIKCGCSETFITLEKGGFVFFYEQDLDDFRTTWFNKALVGTDEVTPWLSCFDLAKQREVCQSLISTAARASVHHRTNIIAVLCLP